MNRLKTSLIFLAFLSLGLYCYPQKNMELVGRLVYPLDSGISKSIFLNDIWGYTDPNGREYALVGTLSGLSIVDLQNPAQPQEIHFVRGDTSLWRDIKTYQNFAYVVNETGGGLKIIDLSGLPESVQSKDTIFTIDSLFIERELITQDTLENGTIISDTTQVTDTTIQTIRRAHNLYQDQGTLYMVGPNQYRGGMVMIDLSQDPWNPSIKGFYNERYVHDVYVRNNLAYTAEINNRQLGIVDVSNPEIPEVLGTRNYPGAFTHNTWLNDSGTVCFTTDERSAAFVIAWDIQDPENIEELDRTRSSLSKGRATPHNVHVLNDFLITSYYKDGVNIVDAQRPHNLVEVGYYDTHPDSLGGFDGVWGAYPFLPSGLVLASDRSEGLFVFRPNYTRGSYFEGRVVDALTGEPLDQVEIFSRDIPRFHEQSANDGSFALGTIKEGEIQVVVKKFGYLTDTLTVNLQNGELIDIEIPLEPASRKVLLLSVQDELSGEALSEAPLSIFIPEFALRMKGITNNEGIYSESLPVDSYELLVGKWGYKTQKIFLNLAEVESDTLLIPLQEGYYDDFGLDFGWEALGIPKKGIWERAFPNPTFLGSTLLSPDKDDPNDLDSMAYVTDNSGISFQDSDVDNVRTVLRSPIMDLSEYENPVIHFSYWLAAIRDNFSFLPSSDSLEVYIHTPDDSALVEKFGGPLSNGWVRQFFLPSDHLELSDSMWVTYSIIDPPPSDFIEVGIDRFEVNELQSIFLQVREQGSQIPLDQTSLSFEPNELSYHLSAETDVDGNFRGGLPLDKFNLILGRWGYKTQQIELDFLDDLPDSIIVELAPSYYDDFKFDFGWEVDGMDFEGHWQRAIPRATTFEDITLNPGEDVANDFGSYAFVTDNSGTESFDGDVDQFPTTLLSPFIDLRGYNNPLIRFYYWLTAIHPNSVQIPSADSLKVYIQSAQDTQLVAKFGGPYTNTWESAEIPLERYPNLGDSIRIAFFIQDTGEEDLIEVGIDLLEIVEADIVSSLERLEIPFQVFPNPVRDHLYINNPTGFEANWKLFDAQGRLVNQGILAPDKELERLPFPFPHGIYFLYLENEGISRYWKKLIK